MLHSRYEKGNLVYYDGTEWVDAIGANICKFIEDFVNLPVDDTTGDPTAWTMTVVEAGLGGDSTAALKAGAEGGVLLITTDNAENDGVNLQLKGEAFKLASGKPCYFGIRFKISAATQSDFLVGLAITDTDLLGGVTDGIYFRKVDGSTDVKFVLEKNSTETESAAILTADTNFHTLSFVFDGTRAVAFVDGVEQSILAQTNLPNDEFLTPSIHFLTGDAAAITMEVDWVRVIQINA